MPMQIIMNDHIELKYYKRCIEEINRKYPFDAVLDRKAIIDVCDTCINILAQDFTNEIRKYKHPQDLFQFMLIYSDLAIDKPHSETSHILMQMCRYIFILIPNLNLSHQATPIINTGACDLSEIFFITKLLDKISQQRAIQIMNEECVFQLYRNTSVFEMIYTDDSLVKAHTLLNQQNNTNSLFRKHCFNYSVLKQFREELFNAFGEVTDKLFDIVCNTQPANINLNNISFREFKDIIEGRIPERIQILKVVNISKLFLEYPHNAYLEGLLLSSNNSDIHTAINKPYNKNLRTRYRPILEFNIDGKKEYHIAPFMFQEAIEEICGNLLPFKEFPDEWTSNQTINNFAKKLFQEHDKWLENLVVNIITKSGYRFLQNKKSINNISLEKADAYIGQKHFPNSHVGEIDFIVIDISAQTVYVIDAKHIKTRYHLQSFAADSSKFIGAKGYNEKLSFKVEWIKKHLSDVGKESGHDCSNYSVQGLFVTETFVYYGISSLFPIIPIAWLNEYFITNDKLCFLKQ